MIEQTQHACTECGRQQSIRDVHSQVETLLNKRRDMVDAAEPFAVSFKPLAYLYVHRGADEEYYGWAEVSTSPSRIWLDIAYTSDDGRRVTIALRKTLSTDQT